MTDRAETRRVVLITGASRGLGRALALALAPEPVDLILSARSQGALEAVDDEARALGASPVLAPLDLRKPKAIDDLGASIFKRFRRLDGFAHLAAHLGELMPAHQLKPSLMDELLAVNVTAAQRLIRTLDPVLRQSAAPRAVFATCAQAATPKPFFGGYGATKAAQDALVLAWARENQASALRINLYDPGPMATRLRSHAYMGERDGDQPAPERKVAALSALLDPACERHGERVLHAG